MYTVHWTEWPTQSRRDYLQVSHLKYPETRKYSALSNQSDLPAFFSPRKVNLKIGLIPEDDLPRLAKSHRMTCQDWPNPVLRQAGISKEDLIRGQCLMGDMSGINRKVLLVERDADF
jgi:hypothetical protein